MLHANLSLRNTGRSLFGWMLTVDVAAKVQILNPKNSFVKSLNLHREISEKHIRG